MKITMYELIGLVKAGKAPKKVIFNGNLWEFNKKFNQYQTQKGGRNIWSGYNFNILNDEVEILEEENKFTKEDFIKETMDLEDITREEFNKRYEVKECNCGRGFCKGFIKVEKVQEERKIPEKLSTWFSVETKQSRELNIEYANTNFENMYEKINEICACLKSKGDRR